MKILYVNNFLTTRGGAENSLLNTARLLRENNHKTFYFTAEKYLKQKSNIFFKTLNLLYSVEAKKRLSQALEKYQPDIVHLNNIYHHLSPSVIDAVKARKIPMLMTLRDYKLVCAIYKLWRNGKICEECKNKNFFSILKNRCQLKGNPLESLLLWLEMTLHHKILHIYDKVDIFIAPSKFMIKKLHQMGFAKKIIYLPNFVNTHEFIPRYDSDNQSVTYFGRLVSEKGLFTLIEAIKGLPTILKIIGKGNQGSELKNKVKKEKINNVKFLGWLEGEKLKKEISDSMFTILPSIWYENNPRSIIESFALGKPVIASNIGGIPELVKDENNGFLFGAQDLNDLREKIILLATHDKVRKQMGKKGRELVEKEYNEESYYKKIMKIYKSLLG